ncbi:hypothetical protein [Amaricoccus macauensis]
MMKMIAPLAVLALFGLTSTAMACTSDKAELPPPPAGSASS